LLGLLEQIDHTAFSLINGLAGKSLAADHLILFVSDSYIAKGIPVMMVWWGLWFRNTSPPSTPARQQLLAVLVASIAAIAVGRLLALTLPFRDRPIHSPSIDAVLPANISTSILQGWSGFPSDHAVMFFALAAGVYLVHRWIGSLLFLHAAIVVSLPRVYSGLHWPGDILFGALIGVSIAFFLAPIATKLFDRHNVLDLEERYPFLFYPALFFITFQAASMFDSSRAAVDFFFLALTKLLLLVVA
jgi:undecaprenyl-diphosphatase